MIRIRVKNLGTVVNKHKKILMAPYDIEGTLKRLSSSYRKSDPIRADFFDLLIKNLPKLLFGVPSVLESQRAAFEPAFDTIVVAIKSKHKSKKNKKAAVNQFKKEIFSAFDYTLFSRTNPAYGAYSLVKSLDIEVCPYCNRMNTNTIFTKQGKTRARLDHWFDKSRYPYFALSFYNLIPSCHVCNSDLKNTKRFSFNDHIHPYTEGFEKEFKFATGVTQATYKSGNPNSLNVKIAPVKGTATDMLRKAGNNISVFCIETLYNCHKEKAAEIIEESDQYSKTYIKTTLMTLKSSSGIPLYKNVEEVIERRFKFKTKIEDLGKEAFAKFRRDIAEEQGLKF